MRFYSVGVTAANGLHTVEGVWQVAFASDLPPVPTGKNRVEITSLDDPGSAVGQVLNITTNPVTIVGDTHARHLTDWRNRLSSAFRESMEAVRDWWVYLPNANTVGDRQRIRSRIVIEYELVGWLKGIIAIGDKLVSRAGYPSMTIAQLETVVKHVEALPGVVETWYDVGKAIDTSGSFPNQWAGKQILGQNVHQYANQLTFTNHYTDYFQVQGNLIVVPRTPDYSWTLIAGLGSTSSAFNPLNLG